MNAKPESAALHIDSRVAVLYAIFGGLWILLSDRLLAAFITDTSRLSTLQTYKGWAFVALSAWLIYSLLRRELTLRRIAETGLRESEEHYRLMAQNAEDMIWTMNLDFQLTYVSPAVERALGYSAQEILASTPERFLTPESFAVGVEVFREEIDNAQSQPDPNYARLLELEYRRQNGSTFWVEMKFSLIRDLNGHPIIVLGVGRDITARKQAEEALRQSEEKYRAVVEKQTEFIVRWKPDGIRTFANDAYRRYFGLTTERAVSASFMPLIVEEDRRAVEEKISRLASGTTNAETEVHRVIRPDGSIGWQEWTDQAIRDGSGQIVEFQSVGRDITARKQAEEQVQLQLRRMSAMSEIDRAINSSLDMRVSLEILLSEVLSQLGVHAASVLLLNASSDHLEYVAGKGFRTSGIRQLQVRLGEGLAGWVGLERKALHIPVLAEAGSQFKYSEFLKNEDFVEYLGVPLVAKGMLKGVLEIFHRTPLNPDANWVNYLETLGQQAAIAIDNAQLFESTQRSNLELMTAYDATIEGWAQALELRDTETKGHSHRAVDLTLELARKMGIEESQLAHIRRGVLLHDIGKMGIPDAILQKPAPLTDDEWEIMRQHPLYAHKWLSSILYLQPALDIPYCHHEKWDGTGYPRGLNGEQIPVAARIFAVVDVWDALASDRPYRKAWAKKKVLKYIREQSGKQFDPRVVDVFLSIIANR